MKLLSITEVKKEKVARDTEQVQRMAKINREETELAKRLNTTKARVEAEKERITSELDSFEKFAQERIKGLRMEVDSLESRRKEALKPIHDTLKEAESKLASARIVEEENLRQREEIKEIRASLIEARSQIIDRQSEIKEIDEDIKNRISKVVLAETAIKEATNSLSRAWTDYHRTVREANNRLEKWQKEVDDGRKTNEIFLESLKSEQTRINQEKIAIRDKYAALEQAKKHLGIK